MADQRGRLQVRFDPNIPLRRQEPELGDAIRGDLGQVRGGSLALFAAGVQPGQFQQRIGQPAHSLGGLLAGANSVAVLLGTAVAAQGRLGVGNDHGQGGAQFVGRVGGKLPLALESGIQPRESGVEHVGQLGQFAVHVAGGDALGEAAFRDAPGGAADLPDRDQQQAGGQIAAAQAQ